MNKLIFSLLLILCSMTTAAQPRIAAHRGFWRTEGSAQNSITALQKAAAISCWGCELDVWVTADGVPVVFHDATVDDIRIEDTTYATLMNHRLQNGEFIPTLQQFLTEATRLTDCRLVLEIKPHRNELRDRHICALTIELIKMLGLEERTDYISFSRNACRALHEMAPQAKVAYLTGDLSPAQVKEMGLTGIDYQMDVLTKRHPEWIQEAKQLGLEVNVWTVDGEEELRRYAAMPGIDIITTNDPDVLKRILGE